MVIALHKGSTVSGQIEFEGETRPPLTPAVRIYASEVGGSRGMNLPGTSTVNPDWSFEISGVSPGKRLFRMTGLPPTHVLKSVTVGGEDVTDAPTEFDGKGTLGDVKLLLTERVTSIIGEVTDDRGRQVPDYALVAFAADPERWNPGSRFIGSVRPDQNGRYSLSGLPPGDYLVVAVDSLERGQAEDREFLTAIRSKATAVSLAEGEVKPLHLKLVAPER